MKEGIINSQRYGLPILFIFFTVVFVGFEPNTLHMLLAIVVLFLGFAWLWRPGESPILLFLFMYSWIEASAAILYANWRSMPLIHYPEVGGDIDSAVDLSLLGLLCITAGMRYGINRWNPVIVYEARKIAIAYPIEQWFAFYALISFIITTVVAIGAAIIPGLMQIWLALNNLRWAAFYLLAFASFLPETRSRRYVVGAFIIEFAIGVGGFFSDFKTVFFFLLMALVSSQRRLSAKNTILIAFIIVPLLYLGIIWTSVKQEYRSYVSAGTSQQIVSISLVDGWAKLIELVYNLNDEKIASGSDQFVRRVAYVEFFGLVLDRVPRLIPFEYGSIWMDAIVRPFMPRMFFPNKSEIRDSDRTNYFAGNVTANDDVTSISLGYLAESYIDFGPLGMMVCLFSYGYFLGKIYYFLINWRVIQPLLGMSLATAALFGATAIENSITKAMGGLVASLIVTWIVAKYITPRVFPWITKEPSR